MASFDFDFQEKRILSYDGYEITYHMVGKGTPVLIANGLGGNVRAWSHLLRRFETTHRLITWDYRGLLRGAPPSSSLSVATHAMDGIAVMNAEGIRRADVWGWSMGVQVALEIFRYVPQRVRSMVFLNGVAGSPLRWVEGGKWVAFSTLGLLKGVETFPWPLEKVIHLLAPSSHMVDVAIALGLASPTIDRALASRLIAFFEELDLRAYAQTLKELARHDAHDVLDRIDVPVLVFAGGRDRLTPKRAIARMVRRLRRAKLVVVPQGTHYLAIEYPHFIAQRIVEFWREHQLGEEGGGWEVEA
ncbi:MAG: alpha/beta hydrolase [Sandaracinaceae bacterium]|nr:alpha/beta hydrolase [Sandaracinaceae bacterium]